jgi:hypothetical protein
MDQNPTLLRAKMTQQGKRLRNWFLLTDGNSYEVDFNTFF